MSTRLSRLLQRVARSKPTRDPRAALRYVRLLDAAIERLNAHREDVLLDPSFVEYELRHAREARAAAARTAEAGA